MKIREYENTDLPEILSIYLKCKPEEFHGEKQNVKVVPLEKDPNNFSLFISAEKYILEQECIVGFITILGESIGWLYVDPSYRNQGVGSSLLEHVINTHNTPLALKVTMSNNKAINLYKKYGFIEGNISNVSVQGANIEVLEMRMDCG